MSNFPISMHTLSWCLDAPNWSQLEFNIIVWGKTNQPTKQTAAQRLRSRPFPEDAEEVGVIILYQEPRSHRVVIATVVQISLPRRLICVRISPHPMVLDSDTLFQEWGLLDGSDLNLTSSCVERNEWCWFGEKYLFSFYKKWGKSSFFVGSVVGSKARSKWVYIIVISTAMPRPPVPQTYRYGHVICVQTLIVCLRNLPKLPPLSPDYLYREVAPMQRPLAD